MFILDVVANSQSERITAICVNALSVTDGTNVMRVVFSGVNGLTSLHDVIVFANPQFNYFQLRYRDYCIKNYTLLVTRLVT